MVDMIEQELSQVKVKAGKQKGSGISEGVQKESKPGGDWTGPRT